MEGELSVPRNLQPISDLVRGTDRVSAAVPKRDGRPGKGRSFDLGAHRRTDEERPGGGAPAEHNAPAADEHPAAPADGQAPSEGDESRLDYQA